MLFIPIFYFILGMAIVNQEAFATEKPLGILVQVSKKETLESKEFKGLISKNNLTTGRYYSSLKIQSFKLSNEKENNLESLCKTIKKTFSGVLTCELNLELSPQSNSSEDIFRTDKPSRCFAGSLTLDSPLGELAREFATGILNIISSIVCDLFNTRKVGSGDYKLEPGLSPFWAQEYIGSDLLKEEMSKRGIDTSNASHLLGVWDSHMDKHGEQVANLIAGPFASSLISLTEPQDYVNLHEVEDYMAAYQKAHDQCQSHSNCPRFINNSMGWGSSNLVKQVVQNLETEQGAVFVTSAGNDSYGISPRKRESSRAGHSIVVVSHAPNGLSSKFTNVAPEVDITAPSDNHILSYDHKGSPTKFGGTSGATPLVTSTLLAFELVAGVKLSTPQFKDLLEKTAITHRDDPRRKVTGAGYLNSYKVGAVAFKLVRLCRGFIGKDKRDECMLKELGSEDLYDFSKEIKEDQIINSIESAFPECGGDPTSQNQVIACEKKESALRELRKASFLNPKNLKYWEKLACVHRGEGLDINARYYSRLARGRRITEKERNVAGMSNADISELLNSDEVLKKDRDFILAAVKKNEWVLKFAHKDLKKDREVVLTAVKQNGLVFQYAHEDLKKDRDFILAAVKGDGLALKYVHEDLKKDREVVLTAVKQNKWVLEYAHEDLKKDRDFILAAVKQDGWALKFAHEDLKKDREVILTAVKQNGLVFEYAHEDLKKDRDFILAAVKEGGEALNFAHEDFRKDREIVLTAVKQSGWALRRVHEDLKKDREIVLTAVKQSGWALDFVHEDLKKDREVVLTAVKEGGQALDFAHEKFKKDREIVLTAVKEDGWALMYAHEDLKKDRDFILAAVKQSGMALEYAHEDLKKDREVVLTAVKQDRRALQHAHEDLKDDPEIMVAAN